MTNVHNKLAAIDGLTFADCFAFFAAKATERDHEIAALVDTDDNLECDGAVISEGDDNGAWVLTWAWVSFDDTDLDKERDDKVA